MSDRYLEWANDAERDFLTHVTVAEDTERSLRRGAEIFREMDGRDEYEGLPEHLALELSVERSISQRRGAPLEWFE